jgi:hypothetical protein
MSDSPATDPLRDLSREEIMSALFGHMVIQNTNMALLLLGQIPHPETGEYGYDIDGARMFIDQLEMLEAKTKGNLTAQEDKLLKQSLTHLRMTFVQAMENPPQEGPKSAEDPTASEGRSAKPDSAPAGEPGAAAPAEEESRKRFSKKF